VSTIHIIRTIYKRVISDARPTARRVYDLLFIVVVRQTWTLWTYFKQLILA